MERCLLWLPLIESSAPRDQALERPVRGSAERASGAERLCACGANHAPRMARPGRTLGIMRNLHSALLAMAPFFVMMPSDALARGPSNAGGSGHAR